MDVGTREEGTVIMNKIAGLVTLLLASAALPAAAQSVTRGPQECAALQNLQVPGVAVSEISAEWIPAAPTPNPSAIERPAHCALRATLDRRQGADGQPYGIGFGLALPGTWNGRFLFQGGGGFNGVLMYPLGAAVAGSMPALARGFAVVSTDSGHRSPGGNALDTTFMRDQQASLDFAYRAVDRVTAVAKMIIARHYAQPVSRSYYVGCSTGGREAMLAAQRHPMEFDGVIAGAPNMRAYYAVLGVDWVTVQLNQVAPRDSNGQPVTREALSSAQKQAVLDGIRNACDADDGLRDGLVFNTSGCAFDPKTLVCDDGDGCLTAAQAEALERAFAGPRTSDGRQLYSPFPFDTGIADGAQRPIPGLLYGGFNASPASTTDLEAAVRWADGNEPSALTDTFGWTNMTTFASRGGKMIFFHGMSDPTFSALDTVDYYNRLAEANGGADAVQRWSRLFLVPGMGHCGGGSLATGSFDLLTALVDWVERDIPPDAVVAGTTGEPRLTRPLCPYPQYAHYSGRGDANDASSFVCRAP
jgi:feruloyl esterase